MFPSFRRDLREYICACESVRKQPAEQRAELPLTEALRLILVHRSLRFPSSGARMQHGTHRMDPRAGHIIGLGAGDS